MCLEHQLSNTWYLDSGCSKHMTGSKSLLTDYVEEVGPPVSFGDNSKGFTKGHGKLSNGNVSFFKVSYVDGLKHNLLSVSQICSLKNKVLFD